MKILNVFLYLAAGMITRSQNYQAKDTRFIDKYGATIILDRNLKLIKPVDKEFLLRNLNSKLMQPGLDSLTEYRVVNLARTHRNTYRIKIAYLFFNSEKRMIGHRDTYYRLVVTKSKSKFLINEFQYEEMDF